MSDEAVYRTALATPGLSNTNTEKNLIQKLPNTEKENSKLRRHETQKKTQELLIAKILNKDNLDINKNLFFLKKKKLKSRNTIFNKRINKKKFCKQRINFYGTVETLSH